MKETANEKRCNESICFNLRTNAWEQIPRIVKNNTEIRTFICNLPMTKVARRGLKYLSFSEERPTYTRNNIATIEAEKYGKIINSLTEQQFKVWEHIRKGLGAGCNAVKLNVPIVQDITKIKDYSNADKIIKKLVETGIITKVNGYKDLYSVDVNLYFKGDYNKWVTEYLNKHLDTSIDYSCDMNVDEDVQVSDWQVNEEEQAYGESEHR